MWSLLPMSSRRRNKITETRIRVRSVACRTKYIREEESPEMKSRRVSLVLRKYWTNKR